MTLSLQIKILLQDLKICKHCFILSIDGTEQLCKWDSWYSLTTNDIFYDWGLD